MRWSSQNIAIREEGQDRHEDDEANDTNAGVLWQKM
jgi:hypothetical protein